MKNKKTREKGITLIALIITVIILLILAGIAVSALGNNGLFSKSKDAVNKYKEAEKNEKDIINEYEKLIEKLNLNLLIVPTVTSETSIAIEIKTVGDFTGFDYYLSEANGEEEILKVANSSNKTMQFDGLTPSSRYKVKVVGVTTTGNKIEYVTYISTVENIVPYGYIYQNNVKKESFDVSIYVYDGDEYPLEVELILIKPGNIEESIGIYNLASGETKSIEINNLIGDTEYRIISKDK